MRQEEFTVIIREYDNPEEYSVEIRQHGKTVYRTSRWLDKGYCIEQAGGFFDIYANGHIRPSANATDSNGDMLPDIPDRP